jgi:hypothetical protein
MLLCYRSKFFAMLNAIHVGWSDFFPPMQTFSPYEIEIDTYNQTTFRQWTFRQQFFSFQGIRNI